MKRIDLILIKADYFATNLHRSRFKKLFGLVRNNSDSQGLDFFPKLSPRHLMQTGRKSIRLILLRIKPNFQSKSNQMHLNLGFSEPSFQSEWIRGRNYSWIVRRKLIESQSNWIRFNPIQVFSPVKTEFLIRMNPNNFALVTFSMKIRFRSTRARIYSTGIFKWDQMDSYSIGFILNQFASN